ncbi:MAG: 3D domain-containing protein [Myxococcales bacterium]|nr:3D domain-containing protein [Polyangiaceae bacterium]MDW8247730.1 3D domain-containing protein [Myxococcales bacterium]
MSSHFRFLLFVLPAGCVTGGAAWMAQPLGGDDPSWTSSPLTAATKSASAMPSVTSAPPPGPPASRTLGGKVLGTFRNTYYNFPSAADYRDGPPVRLMSATCTVLAEVPQSFHDVVCVQGSGRLKDGTTVSFARRDCECAALCPRSNQKICFDALDRGQFPWGRGATGRPITPLLTVAVDPSVIELGTALYLPEFDGLPREEGGEPHDGCFVAQDRGVRVQGNHIDIFTGLESTTRLWNQLVPSNKGVTVIVGSPRCQR